VRPRTYAGPDGALAFNDLYLRSSEGAIMGRLAIFALFAAGFAIGVAYVTAFEIVPARTACASRICHLHIAGG
jgi:hypothetical protein